ncbi:response regulator transcription factor [Mucilaginibacter sp. ZT4R22]|uniref:Response regulator transcription factor n=1 Tax=Mucilaginibacter pankratovii TaxID=2772110 RepID=A0ABR7WJW7_9SPHI|nr:response regulator [Mucilaginibacter pankratovii]MBD1362611.1 response regulator transcription factor [Mucilaginibacter pankratovii]
MPLKKVLIIDDDEDLLSLVEYILKEENIEVISTTVSLSVVEISAIDPDLILLDEWLRDNKGTEICKALKNTPSFSKIPVILLSAVSNLSNLAKRCAADAFIEKPFDIGELVSMVKALI